MSEMDEAFLSAWHDLMALPLVWWPEIGRMDTGAWYCELRLGARRPELVGPAIRATAPTAAEAIARALENIHEHRQCQCQS